MIRTTYDLLDSFSGYANPDMKIKRMVQEGNLFRLRRRLYVTTQNISSYLVVGVICCMFRHRYIYWQVNYMQCFVEIGGIG